MTDFGRRPPAHNTTHQDGGADEISVAALSGELADKQLSAWAKVSGKPSTFAPSAHKTSHQNGGGDQISAAGLAGRINYIDLGTISAPHFDEDDLYTDGNWHSLYLYPIIPSTSKAVLLRVGIVNAGVGRALIITNLGNQQEYNSLLVRTQVANVRIYSTGIVNIPTIAWINYWATSSVWGGIQITVGGYFI